MVTRIYANAIAKYNEGKLLDREKLHRLADAEFSDAVKMLCEYGYGNGTVEESSYDVDTFISSEISALIAYATDLSPNENLSRILTNRFLYSNAKAYYKAKCSGKSNPAALYGMDGGELGMAIEQGEYNALPSLMAEALTELDALFAETPPDPKTIDIVLTRAMYADNAACARKAKSKTMKAFVAGEIDLRNITAALRARALGMREAALSAMWIAGGRMDEEEILALYREEDPLRMLADSRYDFLAEGQETLSLPVLEARADDYLSRIWEKEAEDMLSLSPFVRYFLAQLSEYATVKMILTCLKNGAKNEILPRLRAAGR